MACPRLKMKEADGGVGVGGGMMVGGLDYFCGLADRQLVCFALEVLDRKQ